MIGAALLVLWMAVATTFGSCAMPDAVNGMEEARVAPPQGGAGGDIGSEGGWRARAQAARDEIRYLQASRLQLQRIKQLEDG